jgi:DNA-binding NtrC family response regulator
MPVKSIPSVAKSKAMLKLHQTLDRVKKSSTSVLIYGETGTGKEVIAHTIHEQSDRKGPFIAVNCPAIPSALAESELFGHEKGAFTGASNQRHGKFLLAHKGTIFLDEVADLPLDLQSKLLRVLQEREIEPIGSTHPTPIDVRLIAATSKNIRDLMTQGLFREDLYYRLADIEIRVPRLSERVEDFPELIEVFAKELASETESRVCTFTRDAIRYMQSLSWPGNVRELRSAVRRIALMSDTSIIDDRMVAEDLASKGLDRLILDHEQTANLTENQLPPVLTIEALERQSIEKALMESGHNVSKAAQSLGIGRTTIYRKMKKYDIAS